MLDYLLHLTFMGKTGFTDNLTFSFSCDASVKESMFTTTNKVILEKNIMEIWILTMKQISHRLTLYLTFSLLSG